MNICESRNKEKNYCYLIMKCEVKLYKAGQVFTEEVIATDYQNAREVALARNPGSKVVSVTAVFK